MPWFAPLIVAVALGVEAPQLAPAPAPARPNIVFIIADDLGYGELGCYRAVGSEGIATPHLDALAASGTRFTDGYVTCPVCAPTRAGILTGRYQQRIGLEMNPSGQRDNATFGLPRSSPTLAERLSLAGYETAMVGKWHLGSRVGFRPTERGFGEFFGFLNASHAYRASGEGVTGVAVTRGTDAVVESEYLTDAFTREATSFIARKHDNPYFLYLTFNAVHAPMEADDTRAGRAKEQVKGSARRQTFAAMLIALDDGVGRVMQALDASGASANTLVFFLSDNGGPTRATTSRNDPLRGMKGQLFEGGVRVPFIMRWPQGGVPAGATCSQPVISLDMTATALAAARAEMSSAEGINLVPLARGGCAAPAHEALFWRYDDQWAVRMGDWKLVVARENRTAQTEAPSVFGAVPKLFNLRDDIAESKDLAASHPEKVAQLRAAFDAWNAGNVAPKWGTRPAGANATPDADAR